MVLDVQKPTDPAGVTLESWAQGFMVGSLIIMACVTVANMRRKVLLHKLILIEVSNAGLPRVVMAITDWNSCCWALFMARLCLPIHQSIIGI